MENWLFVGAAVYLWWWLCTRFRVYRWIGALVVLLWLTMPDDEGLVSAAPVLAFYWVSSLLVFHGRRFVMALFRWM